MADVPEEGRVTEPVFKCEEFDGCEENYCAYEGDELCHWRNVPVDGCGCRLCSEANKIEVTARRLTPEEQAVAEKKL